MIACRVAPGTVAATVDHLPPGRPAVPTDPMRQLLAVPGRSCERLCQRRCKVHFLDRPGVRSCSSPPPAGRADPWRCSSGPRGGSTPTGAARVYPDGLPQRAWLGALRRRVRDGRGEQRLLPAARAVGVRALARADARRASWSPSRSAATSPTSGGCATRPSRSRASSTGRRGWGTGSGRTSCSCRRPCRADAERLDACLAAFPRDARVAVEPRHESWWTDEVREVLERRGAALCWADRRGRPVTPLWRTAGWGYVRLHEGTASPRPSYGRQRAGDLARPHRRRLAAGPPGRRVRLLQQRPRRGAAVRNARTLPAMAGNRGFTRALIVATVPTTPAAEAAPPRSVVPQRQVRSRSSTRSTCFWRPGLSWSRGSG